MLAIVGIYAADLWDRNDDFDISKHNCFAEEDFLYDYDDDSAMVYRMLDI